MSDLELDLKRKLRQRWKEAGHWSCPYEPGLGSATGYPDLQLLHPTFRTIAPIELKVADKLKDGRIFPREVRPAQVTWNYEFAVAGGRSAILIGHKTKTGWDSYVFSARWLKPWREGFLTEDALFIFEYEDCVDGLLQTCSWCAGGIDHALVRDHNVSQNRVRGARLLG